MKFFYAAAFAATAFLSSVFGVPVQRGASATYAEREEPHHNLALLSSVSRADSLVDPGQVEVSVARLLEQGHYTRQKLDEAGSKKILDSYLRLLDPNRVYFTQQDVDSFSQKYLNTLSDTILRGDLVPAREIYAVYKKRVENRIAKNKILLKQPLSFTTQETVVLNREKIPWPLDEAAADKLWNAWVKAQVLQERLGGSLIAKSSSPPKANEENKKNEPPAEKTNAEKTNAVSSKIKSILESPEIKNQLSADELARLQPPKTPEETVARRFDSILRDLEDEKAFDVISKFLSAVSQSYDPHSEYMSPDKMENFAIMMKLSLVGVGAVLREMDGYTRVTDIIPGGPADKNGQLKVNDRIIGVAQGNAPFEDVVNMKLEKVVDRIRGKKETPVRLLVIPGDSTDDSKRKLIELVRDEVKLKDQQAKAEVIDLQKPDGGTTRIGWIQLPSFYANIDPRAIGPQANTTRDVAILLKRLEQERIEALVMDLRKNGGGSLMEAISLTGLFVPKGPVVQVKDSTGRIAISYCDDAKNMYKGPLVVLVNHLSASASEIFAAALQDYGRAVIVGDSRTFCKGTVQTVLDVGRFMPFFSLAAADAGSLKLTIQKFYRIKGGSTQLKGVESDVVLPSLYDNPQIGEGALPNALPYDEVPPVAFQRYEGDLFLAQLRARSMARIGADPEFTYIREEMERIRKRLQDNTVSLNEKERKAELQESKARQAQFEKERVARSASIAMKEYSVTLDTVNRSELEPVKYDKKNANVDLGGDFGETSDIADALKPGMDPIKNETLRIAQDLIALTAAEKQESTASISPRNEH